MASYTKQHPNPTFCFKIIYRAAVGFWPGVDIIIIQSIQRLFNGSLVGAPQGAHKYIKVLSRTLATQLTVCLCYPHQCRREVWSRACCPVKAQPVRRPGHHQSLRDRFGTDILRIHTPYPTLSTAKTEIHFLQMRNE